MVLWVETKWPMINEVLDKERNIQDRKTEEMQCRNVEERKKERRNAMQKRRRKKERKKERNKSIL